MPTNLPNSSYVRGSLWVHYQHPQGALVFPAYPLNNSDIFFMHLRSWRYWIFPYKRIHAISLSEPDYFLCSLEWCIYSVSTFQWWTPFTSAVHLYACNYKYKDRYLTLILHFIKLFAAPYCKSLRCDFPILTHAGNISVCVSMYVVRPSLLDMGWSASLTWIYT